MAPKVKVPAPAPPLEATVTLASQQLCELAGGDGAGAGATAAAPLEVPALRLAACAAAQVGREHARLGQVRLLRRPWELLKLWVLGKGLGSGRAQACALGPGAAGAPDPGSCLSHWF